MLIKWTYDFSSENTVYCIKTRENLQDCFRGWGIQLCLQDGREGVYILKEYRGER